MIVEALILAGGRAARLGGASKGALLVEGATLLDRTIGAARAGGARRVVVVGETDRDDVVAVREEPAFGGPVAAIAEGVRALTPDVDAVLVLACDMPHVTTAIPALVAGFAGDGAIAVDGGRRQQLALLVASTALHAALERLGDPAGASVRRLLDGLELRPVEVPAGATDDIDTWEDAARLGVARSDLARS